MARSSKDNAGFVGQLDTTAEHPAFREFRQAEPDPVSYGLRWSYLPPGHARGLQGGNDCGI